MPSLIPRGLTHWVPALLLLLALPVFWPGLFGGFLFDDFPNLIHADGWKAQALAIPDLLRALHSDISGAVGRPLSLLSFAINHALTGISPFWLKLTSLVWHMLNGVLLWALCHRIILQVPELKVSAPWTATLVALLWLLHPMQVSTVLYVVQRMEIAAATGVLLALLAYVSARSRQMRGQRAWPWLLACVAMMLLGLGFKETALLTPLFALLVEASLFRFRTAGGGVSRPWLVAWAGVLLLGAIAYLALIIPQLQHWPHATRDWGPGERLLTQLPVLAMYLTQMLLPLPDGFLFYYDNYPVSRGLDARTLLAGVCLLGLLMIAFLCRRRWPLVTLGIAWFFVAHALTSNLWPLELAFEHRNYLALFGVLLALVQPLSALLGRLHADARITLLLLPVLMLGALTHIQARIWGDSLQLAWALENRNPDSPRASYGLGEQLIIAAGGDAGAPAWTMALRQFEHAAQLPGDPVLPLQAMILLSAQSGASVPSEVWERFRAGLGQGGFRAEHVSALHAVSQCRIEGRCSFDDSELLNTFLAVVDRFSTNATALTMYANFLWNVMDDRALAIQVQRDAVARSPVSVPYRIALAKFLLANGGEQEFREAKGLIEVLLEERRGGVFDAQMDELDKLASGHAAQESEPGHGDGAR